MKILTCALALVLFAGPAVAGSVNQFEIAQRNQQYNHGGYPPPPPPPPPGYYHKKKHKNNGYDDDVAWAVGGFLGGLLLGQAINPGYGYAAPPVAYCGTVWTMEPDGFGGWQQAPHTVCQ